VALFYLPIYFQTVKGVSAIASGVRLVPLVLGLSECLVSGGCAHRADQDGALTQIALGGVITATGIFNPFFIAGPAITAVGGGLLTTLDLNSTSGQWIGYQILLGIGVGACLTIPLMLAGVVVKPKDIPTSTAIMIFSQSLGGAIMLAAAQGIFQNELVRLLRQSVPALDPIQILSLGASKEATQSIPPVLLASILESFVKALQHTFVLTIPVAAIAFLVSLLQPWFRYHKVDLTGPASDAVEVEQVSEAPRTKDEARTAP
jgi:hypothetical protein